MRRNPVPCRYCDKPFIPKSGDNRNCPEHAGLRRKSDGTPSRQKLEHRIPVAVVPNPDRP